MKFPNNSHLSPSESPCDRTSRRIGRRFGAGELCRLGAHQVRGGQLQGLADGDLGQALKLSSFRGVPQ